MKKNKHIINCVEEGSIATEPTAPTKPGYVFDGWTLNGEAVDFSVPANNANTLKYSYLAFFKK